MTPHEFIALYRFPTIIAKYQQLQFMKKSRLAVRKMSALACVCCGSNFIFGLNFSNRLKFFTLASNFLCLYQNSPKGDHTRANFYFGSVSETFTISKIIWQLGGLELRNVISHVNYSMLEFCSVQPKCLQSGIISIWGSFAAHFGDHWQSILGIICRIGSLILWSGI